MAMLFPIPRLTRKEALLVRLEQLTCSCGHVLEGYFQNHGYFTERHAKSDFKRHDEIAAQIEAGIDPEVPTLTGLQREKP